MIKYSDDRIGRVFIGSHEIGKAYFGANVVFQKGGHMPILPTGYTELRYVNTNNGAYVDTGISGDDSALVFKMIATVKTHTEYGGFFGNYVNSNHNVWRVIQQSGNTGVYLNTNSRTNRAVGSLETTNLVGTRLNIQLSYSEFIVNGVTMTDVAWDYMHVNGTQNTTNIAVGGNAVPPTGPSDIDIERFSIEKNGNTLIQLIPAMRDSDDAVGLFDLVSDTFIPSASNTPFLAGPTV